MKAGAHSFVEKPIEPDTLLAMLERAIERRDLVSENLLLKQKVEGQFRFGNIIGKSKKMHEVLELVESVAGSDANILIQGENGTGKELIANAIHYNSKRAKGPFIKINCAAIPKDLIESELFGYKKGAFTGAQNDKEGLFEMAEGGSLLLDEIGEMPPYLQTKLLRVLQEREYRPIGSDRIVRVDFRLICATNIDLDAALRDGKLREDLYFRINTITLRVPPLRERTEDIPLLCEHFLEKYKTRHQRNVKAIAPAAYHVLIRHRWPGNVRELENVIERGVLVSKGTEITSNDLPESLRTETTATTEFVIPPHRTLAEIEKMAILQTLQRTNWNKQEAAQILGLYRPTLYSKMKKHEIQDGGKSGARRRRQLVHISTLPIAPSISSVPVARPLIHQRAIDAYACACALIGQGGRRGRTIACIAGDHAWGGRRRGVGLAVSHRQRGAGPHPDRTEARRFRPRADERSRHGRKGARRRPTKAGGR